MGIFTDDILVKGFPTAFPKFCFLVHLLVEKTGGKFTFDAVFRYTGKKPIVLAKDTMVRVQKGRGGILNLIISPLVFARAGTGELVLKIAGRTFRRRFSVSKAQDASVFG